MKAAEAREQKVAQDKSFFTGLFTANKAGRRPDPREVPQGRPGPRLQGRDRQLLRLARLGQGAEPLGRRRRDRRRLEERGVAGPRGPGPGPGPGAGAEGGADRPTRRCRPMASTAAASRDPRGPGLHLALDPRLLHLHRRPDGRQPRAVLHRLLAGRQHPWGRRRQLPGAALRPAGAHLPGQHLHLRRALRAARHRGRAGPGPAAAAGRARRRVLPYGVLPAGDDAGRRGRRDVPPAAQRAARAGQPGARLGRHPGAELDHRPELAQAVAGHRQPVGRRGQRGHLPGGPARRAPPAARGRHARRRRCRCAGSSASPCR